MKVKIVYKNEIKDINTEIELKLNYRTFFIYENVMDRSFNYNDINLSSLVDLFYAAITARLQREKIDFLTYDEYLDWLDDLDDPDTLIAQFAVWLADKFTVNSELKQKIEQDQEEEKLGDKDITIEDTSKN